MAQRYWVGGSGIWDTTSTANWSALPGGAAGASAPTSADTANFLADSGSGAYTVTLGSNITVLSVSGGAAVNQTIDFATYSITVVGNGGLVYRSNAVEYLGTPVVNLTYSGSTGTRSIQPGGSTVTNPPRFNISAGTDTITLTTGGVGRFGTLDFTGFSGTFGWNNASVVSAFGDIIFSSGMTLSSGTTSLQFRGTSGTQKITTAGKTIDFPLIFNGVGGTFAFQDALTQGSTRSFTITDGTVQLKNGVTTTVGVLATSGTSQKYLQSTLAGSQATLSQATGTVNASNLVIKDINATGGATWNAFTTNNNVDAGNNLGWDFSTQIGRYIYTRRKNKRILP